MGGGGSAQAHHKSSGRIGGPGAGCTGRGGGSLCSPGPSSWVSERQLWGTLRVNLGIPWALRPRFLSACACKTGCRGPAACSWRPCSQCLRAGGEPGSRQAQTGVTNHLGSPRTDGMPGTRDLRAEAGQSLANWTAGQARPESQGPSVGPAGSPHPPSSPSCTGLWSPQSCTSSRSERSGQRPPPDFGSHALSPGSSPTLQAWCPLIEELSKRSLPSRARQEAAPTQLSACPVPHSVYLTRGQLPTWAPHSPSGLTGYLRRPSSFSSSRARVTLCSCDNKTPIRCQQVEAAPPSSCHASGRPPLVGKAVSQEGTQQRSGRASWRR